ncbi:retroviral-like aspartic protease family protein [bacterium]|nr:retroviral-like aspartic protease family protein [bacterium]
MVDSGAGVSVISLDKAAAAHLSEGDPSRNHKRAGGSIIHHEGHKSLVSSVEDGQVLRVNANVTDVDEPLLSVAQMVTHEATVVISPEGSYIKCRGMENIPVELNNNVYKLKMWVPREQPKPSPSVQPEPCPGQA